MPLVDCPGPGPDPSRRGQNAFAQVQAMSAREEAQFARLEANRARIEAEVAAQTARIRITAVAFPASDVKMLDMKIPRFVRGFASTCRGSGWSGFLWFMLSRSAPVPSSRSTQDMFASWKRARKTSRARISLPSEAPANTLPGFVIPKRRMR